MTPPKVPPNAASHHCTSDDRPLRSSAAAAATSVRNGGCAEGGASPPTVFGLVALPATASAEGVGGGDGLAIAARSASLGDQQMS